MHGFKKSDFEWSYLYRSLTTHSRKKTTFPFFFLPNFQPILWWQKKIVLFFHFLSRINFAEWEIDLCWMNGWIDGSIIIIISSYIDGTTEPKFTIILSFLLKHTHTHRHFIGQALKQQQQHSHPFPRSSLSQAKKNTYKFDIKLSLFLVEMDFTRFFLKV